MNEFRSIDFPEKDRPLRDDVSVLGQMLGEVLLEQHGPELLEQVEKLSRAAGSTAMRDLIRVISGADR